MFFEGGPENLRRLIEVNNVDAVISIGREIEREAGESRRIQDVPIRYQSDIPISVISANKTGVTATKLLNKIRRSMIATVEAAAQGTRVTIVLRQGEDKNQTIGGYDPLFRDDYLCQFRPLSGTG